MPEPPGGVGNAWLLFSVCVSLLLAGNLVLEKISAEMQRAAHRAIYGNTTGRAATPFSPPPPEDLGAAEEARPVQF